MSAPTVKQWGQTAPISVAFPTEKEKALNESLIEELKLQNNFASTEETDRRWVI
jgi:poly(A) polymerase Pap1